MKNTARTRGKRALALLAAFALTGAGVLGAASAANAAPNPAGPGQEGAPSLASLTIHKHAGTSTSDVAPDGTQLDPSPQRPVLAGVEFTVTPVTQIGTKVINALDPTSWDAIADYTQTPPTGLTLGTALTPVVTGTDGSVTVSNLPLGLYLVEETGTGGHNITAKAAPFLVTLPLPTGTKGWNYDVHVYPKNTLDGKPTKTVDDSNAVGAGDEVTWTVTAPPLGIGDGAPLTAFGMTDNLDNRLEYVAGSMVVSVNGVSTEAANFAVVHPGGVGGKLTVSFTGPGLTYLNTLPAGTVISFAFQTKVIGIGVIPNEAVVNVGDVDYKTDPVETNWGRIILTKVDADNRNATLAGAKFKIYTNEAATGDPVSVEVAGVPTTEFTTGADGKLTIPGLKAGNYFLKETVAPAGYVLLPDSIPVTVVATEDATVAVTVENPKQSVPELPLTGGSGTAALIAGGVGLLAVAGGLVLARRRAAVKH